MTTEAILENLGKDYPGHSFTVGNNDLLKVDGNYAYITWEKMSDDTLDVNLLKSVDECFYSMIKKEVEKYFENSKKNTSKNA